MSLFFPNTNELIKYEDLTNDEDRAIYIASTQLYDIIISNVESTGVEQFEREMGLVV